MDATNRLKDVRIPTASGSSWLNTKKQNKRCALLVGMGVVNERSSRTEEL
jgi:hypothetical protein